MAQEKIPEFHMKDLFIDVKLEACVNGTTYDFLGRKLFSTEFFRESVGFGITSIDIEVNTSLQPLVTIIFKDLYGLTVFGGQSRNPDEDNQSHDYSVLFNWPPPKFLFSFKGYLGKPATWVLNLKRTTTSFNSSDGSYDVKCEFVPNQWGFFADLPFLYLLAAKRLRKDRRGQPDDGEEDKNRSVISVFDLIKIGKQVEVKTAETTKEFDEVSKQLGAMKSNLARAITSTNIVSEGDTIIGLVNNQPIVDFKTIKIPKIEDLSEPINSKINIESKLGNTRELNTINAYLLISLKIDGSDNFGDLPKDYKEFSNLFNDPERNSEIETARQNALGAISKNLEKIDDEIRRRVFASSKTKLEKITIGEIFAQLARDAAFVMGSIIDAGLDGYRGEQSRTDARNRLVDDGILIGESFPLMLSSDGEELPATADNLNENSPNSSEDIGVDSFEMKFVKDFINAVTEGIAKDLISGDDFGQDDDILKQRINNMEISSGNPYKAYYTNIATNVLVRAGIVSHFTRSDDPNLPGDYETNLINGVRDDIQSIEEIAERDMQNVTPNIIKSLSDVDFLLLKRFANFFSRFFGKDGNVTNYTGTGSASPSSMLSSGRILNYEVVVGGSVPRRPTGGANNSAEEIAISLSQTVNGTIPEQFRDNLEITTFGTIWNELYQPSLIDNYRIDQEVLVFDEVEEEESGRDEENPEEGGSTFSKNIQEDFPIRNAQNPLSFVGEDFTAVRIINNGIAYMYPFYTGDDYFIVVFRREDHRRAQEANSSPTDAEFKNSDKDSGDSGQSEPLGYIPVNSKYDEDGDKLGRVETLLEYRDGAKTLGLNVSSGANAFDFDKCKNPPKIFYDPGFADVLADITLPGSLIWSNSILQDQNDNDGDERSRGGEVDYPGDFGYTVCAHLKGGSGFVFDLFGETTEARNQRVYIRKCAELLITKIDDIEDERNQIIGEILGKAGEQENAIYKQMHTLFHQWQTLAYSDRLNSRGSLCGNVTENGGSDGGKKGKVFNVAEELERRFGSNHKNIQINEKICFTDEELAEGVDLTPEELQSLDSDESGRLCLSISNQTQASIVPDGTFIYDYPLQRIKEPNEPIDVRDAIINIESLYKPNANTSVLNIIQQVCTKNNFLFIPIPGNPGHLNVEDIYSPSNEPANIQIRNFFHVIFTPTPESRTKTRNTDGTSLADFVNEQKNYNVNSFVIKYGHPNNQIVSNIQVGTDDNKVTAESIVNLQRIVDNENQNKKVTTDCSMLPVLAGRSYKASVDMLGNSQCYPMQFFFLENSPLFGGLYQIMKVKHAIDPNNMTTSLEGIRMRFSAGDGYGAVKPITLQTFRNLGSTEAPIALGKGFDSEQRQTLKEFVENSATLALTQAVTGDLSLNRDFTGISVREGDRGGFIANSVPTLSQTELGEYDSSLGVRELWAPTSVANGAAIIGSEQMYIIDGFPLPARVLSAYKALRDAAAEEGVRIKMNSGYRDPWNNIVHPVTGKHVSSSQLSLRRKNVPEGKSYTQSQIGNAKAAGFDQTKVLSSGKFSPATAVPGRSSHNSGLAVDFNTGSKTGKISSPLDQTVYSWLIINAWRFGFIRTVPSEEWHWEYRPGRAMFSRVPRSSPLWYGLPDKLEIPKE